LLYEKLTLQTALVEKKAKERLSVFIQYINQAYSVQWFHRLISEKCEEVYSGGVNRLMVFVPPQHGKTEILSRMFPAWALGKNPDLKIVGCSYSADLAVGFGRSIQRTMESCEFSSVFPVHLAAKRGSGYTRNAAMFEIPDYKGFYKAVGVGGSLTGTPADIGIIDDPVKDAIEAYSETYRNRVWDWYLNVFLTRLHNESRQILIMTRWHDDDLAGRILKLEPEKWDVVILPAIKEDDSNPDDPRQIGEALWPEKHSLERLLDQKARSERTFSALYQQRPTVEGGNIIKSDWFKFISPMEFERSRELHPYHFFIDTAYTDQTRNDPTGLIATCKMGNTIYITNAIKVYMKFPDLCRFIPKWVKENGYNSKSSIRIEPKANGQSVIDQLQESTGMNITRTVTPTESKETRLNAISSIIEGGRVSLVQGNWNDEFITEVCGFPAKVHDEFVDLLCYGVNYHMGVKNRQDLSKFFF